VLGGVCLCVVLLCGWGEEEEKVILRPFNIPPRERKKGRVFFRVFRKDQTCPFEGGKKRREARALTSRRTESKVEKKEKEKRFGAFVRGKKNAAGKETTTRSFSL